MAAIIAASMASAAGESAGIETPTLVVTVALLFVGVASGVVELTFAVFEVVVPAAVPDGTLKTNWNDALAPLASEAMVQVIVPVPPTGGAVQEKSGPLVCDSPAKVMFAGTSSVSVTFAAVDGPPLATATTYVTVVFDGVVDGPVLVTDRSAFAATTAVEVELLFAGLPSGVAEVMFAVLLIEEPFTADGETWAAMEKVAVPPGANEARLQEIVAPVVHVNDGPVFCVSETNVRPAGRTSFQVTLVAVEGPVLATAML